MPRDSVERKDRRYDAPMSRGLAAAVGWRSDKMLVGRRSCWCTAPSYCPVGLAVLVPVESSVAGDAPKAVAMQRRCCAGRFLLGRVPVYPCGVAGTCGCDSSVVDAGPGQSRALGSPLAHAVNAVCRSDSSRRSPHTLHWSLGDCDWGHRVDVAVALHCSGRLGVDAVVSVQHAAVADGSVSSLSGRRRRVMLLHLSRHLSLVPATVRVTESDARGCASSVL